MMDFLVLF